MPKELIDLGFFSNKSTYLVGNETSSAGFDGLHVAASLIA